MNNYLRFVKHKVSPVFILLLLILFSVPMYGQADKIAVSKLFSDHMVLQRDKPVLVYGTAPAGTSVTVSFNGNLISEDADLNGNWEIELPPMTANKVGQSMTISGLNTITINDILVGDVWICSGQSNMDWRLSGSNRPEDISSADFPGIRQFAVPYNQSETPVKNPTGNWVVCSPSTAGSFSAVAFYYARELYLNQDKNVPMGLLLSSVGGTSIDLWLSPEGVADIPVLHPLFDQGIVPAGPFSLFNGMIFPLAPYGIKGMILYQGENAERTIQSKDSYFLKMKALSQGWKKLWRMDDMPFYMVMIANWGSLPVATPDTITPKGWDSDTRIQQVNSMSLPNTGVASAMDIGDIYLDSDIWKAWHPADKKDVGERLALWPLRDIYGSSNSVVSGPVLKDVVVSGNTLVCSFDHIGSGLMVGKKDWYVPTIDVTGDSALKLFVIRGTDKVWHKADAVIDGNTVVVSSDAVTTPVGIGYACWQNPLGANLYNKEGLPASPFYLGNVNQKYTIVPSSGSNGKIVPSTEGTYLRRSTAFYEIVPDEGYYIEDVMVDGKSVGAVSSYTFDPLYAGHTISASFTSELPEYTITLTKNDGGTVFPEGESFVVEQGKDLAFKLFPLSGLGYTVTVDGVSIGERLNYVFTNVRSNHSIDISFSTIINSVSGYGGNILPAGDVAVTTGSEKTFTIEPLEGFSIADLVIDGASVGALSSYTFTDVMGKHEILARFSQDAIQTSAKIPKENELVLACFAESLPAVNTSGTWNAWFPVNKKLSRIGAPEIKEIDGNKFSNHKHTNGDGYNFTSYTKPIECNGATVVAVVKPFRFGSGDSNWQSVLDVFYDRLVLGVMNGSGKVVVRRNGSVDYSSTGLPSGQTTILSLVVQPDGQYIVYANGKEFMSRTTKSAFTKIQPGNFKTITIGRNGPDNWTTFNGLIGDVLFYKTALNENDREKLESYITNRLLRTGDLEAPSVPSNLKVDEVAGNRLDLSWASSTDNIAVIGYNIYMDDLYFASTPDLTFRVDDLTGETNYEFRIRAYDEAGNLSGFSAPLKVLTKPTTNIGYEDLSTIRIYPNPMVNQLFIESPFDKQVELSIYNVQGKLVFNTNFRSKLVIDRNRIEGEGIYLLKMMSKNAVYTQMLVVE